VRVWLDADMVPVEQLADRLRANPRVQQEHEAYLQADESVPYGQVVRVMGIMRAAGVTKLGIVTDPLVSQ
jgi:biopolymer transport protein TolR